MRLKIVLFIILWVGPGSSASEKAISLDEVARHNTPKDCWTYVKTSVYDITKLLSIHAEEANELPPDHMHQFCGKDSTEGWKWQGEKGISHKKKSEIKLKKYKIGVLTSE